MKPLSEATAKMLKPVALSKQDRLTLELDSNEKFVAQIWRQSLHGGKQFPSTAASTDFLDRVPEKRQLNNRGGCTWELAATDYTAAIIAALWPREQVEFVDNAEVVFNYLLLTTTQQDANAEVYARYTERQSVAQRAREFGFDPTEALGYAPQVPIKLLPCHQERPLAFYQQVAAHNMVESEGYGLFMEQGTGKTPTSIAAICELARRVKFLQGRALRGIIVAPCNVRLNWLSEFARFTTLPGNVTVIRGGQLHRMQQIIEALAPDEDSYFSIVVVSYEALCQTWDMIGAVMWDFGLLDEGHYIKWPETKRAQFAFKLRDVCSKRYVLTGTPIANTHLDCYSLFEFMGKGWSGFNNWKNFRKFYGVFAEVDGDGHQKLVGVQNLPFMKERFAKNSFIVRKAEVLPDLPPVVYSIREVEMTPRQTDVYTQIATKLAMEIEDELDSSTNKTMTVNNVLTKLLRLAQITSGFVTYDAEVDLEGEKMEPKTIEFFTPNAKLDELIIALKEQPEDEKTIVWANWIPDIKTILARLEAEGIDAVGFWGGTNEEGRKVAEDRFNGDPKCRVFVGNPAAGGTGLNLIGYPPGREAEFKTDCTMVVYYSQDWSMLKRSQSEARAHRKGTRRQVRYVDLVVANTIDEQIRERVLMKQHTALEIADIREILANVLRGIKS